MGALSGFLRSCRRADRRPAVEAGGECWTYGELLSRAAAIGATLQRRAPAAEPRLTGVFAHRTATAYAGLVAALLRGHGYVPLNRRYPPERTAAMLLAAGCRELVVDGASAALLAEVLRIVPYPLLVVLPDVDDASALAAAWPLHRFVARPHLSQPDALVAVEPAPDDLAYLLFTSGSTGVPKGVMVTHGNVEAFADAVAAVVGVEEDDRLSQTADLTFDLSTFDLYAAWGAGACLCCPDDRLLFRPGRFIRDARLTVWCSVPSTVLFMQRLGMLKPARYPLLRHAVFCGEPLLLDAARAFRAAAPNAALHNLYGPTELTCACTSYRWDDDRSPAECERAVVPIGGPFPGMEALVVDDDLHEVAAGCEGELLMRGPQLTLGYWHDPERTAAAYVVPPGRRGTYYRTGDRVRRPTAGEPFRYRGRADHQIKVLGHRVELGEIEAAVRDAAGRADVAAIGWPPTPTGAAGIAAFVAGAVDTDQVRRDVAARLPDYMVPRRIERVAALPLTHNGKLDRAALVRLLDEAAA
jgi:amino acid adenylation domain-containing protein